MENALQFVNRKISLSEDEVARNNNILKAVVEKFIFEMKKDSLFNELYERIFYGGSFYDGLRVGEPNEFDLDILLRIPKHMSPTIETTNIPGFVNFKIWNKDSGINSALSNMIGKGGVVEATSVRAWMQSITDKALNSLCPGGKLRVLSYNFQVMTCINGPATTIYLRENAVSIDIDFIPCIVFEEDDWPEGGYRSNPIGDGGEFFIVPKTPSREYLPHQKDLLWRLSFQEQEREMLKDMGFLKPSLRLLKNLRDQERHHAIASYYIKTIFLWEVEAGNTVFDKSLNEAFFAMLDKYIEWLQKKEIPYFWNRKNNLLVNVNPSTLINFANRLKKIRANLNVHNINKFMGA